MLDFEVESIQPWGSAIFSTLRKWDGWKEVLYEMEMFEEKENI